MRDPVFEDSDAEPVDQINGAVTIKYGDMIDGSGKGEFVNSDKIKESSASFLITVKVVNQTFIDHKLTKFNPIKTLPPSEFPEVFGDCFISGTCSDSIAPKQNQRIDKTG